ncbi:hypothetical protein GC207_14400 [bacterium]|nr:hypothetical protein [bacterium]
MNQSSKQVRIGISGGEFKNKGAEAMLLTTSRAVRDVFPRAVLYAWVAPTEFAEARHHGFVPVRRYTGQDGGRSAVNRVLGKMRTLLLYSRLHAIVDVGGYQFGDPWGPADKFKSRAKVLRSLGPLRPRIYYLPQAWGPFELPGMADGIRGIIENCNLAYVRDRVSMQAVEGAVGRDHPHIRSAPDIAWNFPAADASAGTRLLAQLGFTAGSGRLTICVTPNLRVYERAQGSGLDNEYLQALISMISHFLERWDAQIVLLGHEMLPDNSQIMDDRSLCDLIVQAFAGNDRVAHLNRYLPAGEIKSVIGRCQFVVSSRFHCLIAALSQCVPAAAVGWSHKYDELMAEAGLGGNVIQWAEGTAAVKARVDEILGARDQQQAILAASVPVIKESAAASLRAVAAGLG